MQLEKFKIKVNENELYVVYETLETGCDVMVKNMVTKLLVCELNSILIKLLPKYTYPKKQNTISLTAAEAIAFWIVFNTYDFDLAGDLIFVTMRRVLDAIHKQYL